MTFEVFFPEQETALFRRKQPVVAIAKSSIRLNKTAYEELGAETVELAYDRQRETIRIKKVAQGFKIQNKKITSKGFFRHFGINVKGRFLAQYDPESESLLVELRQGHSSQGTPAAD